MPDENILIDNNSDDKVQGKKSMPFPGCQLHAIPMQSAADPSLLVNSHAL